MLRHQLEELIANYSVHALRDEREPFMDRIMELVESEKRKAAEEAIRQTALGLDVGGVLAEEDLKRMVEVFTKRMFPTPK